jgi:8-oxo-dGTP pyrophosphatase MutT (NUDIX family)
VQHRLAEQIRSIATKLSDQPAAAAFIRRAQEGLLTRDENPYTHFCVYFAAFDPADKRVFIGHHKKSGLWLFNGGHIDRGETADEALRREIGEEWGVPIDMAKVGEPKLLTLTEIENPTKQTCTRHYDLWYFVPVCRASFAPDAVKLATEFHATGWHTIAQARSLCTDAATHQALSAFEQMFA